MFAEVAVDLPSARGGIFHYCVPEGWAVAAGQLVRVPFGVRQAQGVVLALSDSSPVEEVRDIAAILDPVPALTADQISLARWISSYYCCGVGDAIKLMVPSELARRAFATYQAKEGWEGAALTPRERVVLQALSAGRSLKVEQISERVPGPALKQLLARLTRRGLLEQVWHLSEVRTKGRVEWVVTLLKLPQSGDELRRAPRQQAALAYLADRHEAGEDGNIPLDEVCAGAGVDPATIRALARSGWVRLEERTVRRQPLLPQLTQTAPQVTLAPAQREVWRAIEASLQQDRPATFLLHGVTGSGKTELYLSALEAAIRVGKQAIVLVPEIALTPQIAHHFASRFPGRVALLHSGLSPREHVDEWQRIRDGLADVAIGSRSAIFAPMPRLGLIVVDEEHEWSYKQDRTPRYHAREVAVRLGELAGATVLLGSATPDVTSYRKAEMGRYQLLTLSERYERTPMPAVEVVDLRQELREGNRGLFSRHLKTALTETLAKGQQAILFLNRRGSATLATCRSCGFVVKCRRCDVALVYHADPAGLVCHQCNRRSDPPQVCPKCWGSELSYFGMGTQRVEAEVRLSFPQARVLRWDADSAVRREDHERLLTAFLQGKADILVGTQMVAKGLDLPQVMLVGVILADSSLYLPDLRAVERTFQLLTQVAGRAGRRGQIGRVVIQTYTPDHYCIQAASRHDYSAFYREEVQFRAAHRYPPFSQLARLVYQHSREERCQEECQRMATLLRLELAQRGLPDLEVLGPAPAYHQKLRGRYRWQLILRGRDVHPLFADIPLPSGWSLDIDPVSFL
ncbi:MAG: primosomal protein N' [Chloroflexi bacterium]|nr:primosomal protein N' [Chloroflexota bacterium]